MTKEEDDLADKLITRLWGEYGRNPALVRRVAITLLNYASEALPKND